eukprot:5755317-Lingulodinium_polyedra.AAC.1
MGAPGVFGARSARVGSASGAFSGCFRIRAGRVRARVYCAGSKRVGTRAGAFGLFSELVWNSPTTGRSIVKARPDN